MLPHVHLLDVAHSAVGNERFHVPVRARDNASPQEKVHETGERGRLVRPGGVLELEQAVEGLEVGLGAEDLALVRGEQADKRVPDKGQAVAGGGYRCMWRKM